MLIRGGAALIQLVAYIPTVACFCFWFYRSAVNARALGAEGFRVTPVWSVAWFFFPIAHLWMPFKAASEIWRASTLDATGGAPDAWRSKGPPLLVSLWWAAWISGTLFGNAASSLARRQPPLDVIGSWALPFGTALQILAAVLCAAVVLRLTLMQDRRAKALASGAGTADPVSTHP